MSDENKKLVDGIIRAAPLFVQALAEVFVPGGLNALVNSAVTAVREKRRKLNASETEQLEHQRQCLELLGREGAARDRIVWLTGREPGSEAPLP